jgi:hypothetical protein
LVFASNLKAELDDEGDPALADDVPAASSGKAWGKSRHPAIHAYLTLAI